MSTASGPSVRGSRARSSWAGAERPEVLARRSGHLAHAGSVEAGERPGVTDAVGRRDLGGVQARVVPHIAVGQRAARCRQGLGQRTVGGQVAGHLLIEGGRVQPTERAAVDARVGNRAPRPGRLGERDETGDPMLLRGRQADVALRSQRIGDLLAEIRTQAAAADPAHHLADQPSVGGGVIPVGGARRPRGRLTLERTDDRFPGQRLLEGHRSVDPRQPGPVGQQVGHGDIVLARRGELRPVGGDGGLDVEGAELGQPVGAHGRQPLGGRVHEHERVLEPGPARRGVGDATPQVDHLPPPVVGGEGCAHLQAVGEVGLEDLADPFEARGHPAAGVGHPGLLVRRRR